MLPTDRVSGLLYSYPDVHITATAVSTKSCKIFNMELFGRKKMLWTGDIFEEAIKNPKKRRIIECLDVLIDGPFILAEKNLKLKYRGSENQRVIDVVKSFETGKTVFMKNA